VALAFSLHPSTHRITEGFISGMNEIGTQILGKFRRETAESGKRAGSSGVVATWKTVGSTILVIG